MPKLTPDIITAAIDGFEAQKIRIDAQIAELRAMLPGGSTEPAVAKITEAVPQRKRRKFSPAAIRRMKAAQQRRWAKVRGESQAPVPVAIPEPKKPKRKLSAAAKAILVANLKKARAAKAAKAKSAKKAPPVSKKAVAQKTAVNAPSTRAVKKAARKTAAKKAATVAAPAVAQTGA